MPNGKSRAKGVRGERDLVHRIPGARRTGHAFVNAPDIVSDFAAYSVKNYTVGGTTIAAEIASLEKLAPEQNHYVCFKVRGKWYVAEHLEQHTNDHGEDLKLG